MVDFEKFFLGEVGIIVKSLEEAVSLIDASDDEGITVDCDAEDYKNYPYWYVEYGVLNITSDYAEAMDHVEKVYTYQTYAFDNQV